MRFKIDENLPIDMAKALQQMGYDAKTVLEQQLNGKPDAIIARVCQQEQRILITLDTDFADIRTYSPKDYTGIIVLRLARQDKPHVLRVLNNILKAVTTEPLKGHLWIVEENKIRIRGGD